MSKYHWHCSTSVFAQAPSTSIHPVQSCLHHYRWFAIDRHLGSHCKTHAQHHKNLTHFANVDNTLVMHDKRFQNALTNGKLTEFVFCNNSK